MARWTVPEDGTVVMEYDISALGCRIKVNNALYQDISQEEGLRRKRECQAIAWDIAARHEAEMLAQDGLHMHVIQDQQENAGITMEQ